MTIRFANTLWLALQRRPIVIGYALTALVVLWVGWLGYTYVISPAPSEEQITSQIVKLNEDDLRAVSAQLTNYRVPPRSTPSVRSTLFSPQP